jgi:type II secretory pathway pseudopilin PulG
MVRSKLHSGTSLVEILVVMVVFLIGILAVIQIFPGGLQILDQSRRYSVATALAKGESERLKTRVDQLPEQILPVSYLWSNTGNGFDLTIVADPTRRPDDLGPRAASLRDDGNLLDPEGNVLGQWQYLSGANVVRRVIGEGRRVPSPRAVGNDFGGLMVLQFAPIVYSGDYGSLFQVYGSDMMRRDGVPQWRLRPFEFFVAEPDTSSASIFIPTGPAARSYRLGMTAYVNSGGNNVRRDVVDAVVQVNADPSGAPAFFELSNFAGLGAGEQFLGVDYDSVRLARRFDEVATFTPGEPYEYKLLSTRLGLLLFNPAGYDFVERRGNRRVPLQARVNYDVYDWRILREEFRVPDRQNGQYRLAVGNLKITGNADADNRTYQGLNLGLPNNPDFVLQDLDSGGIISPTSYRVDRSLGLITFANPSAIEVTYVGANDPVTVDGRNRPVRALYQAVGEWAVQVSKAPSRYRIAFGTPGIGEFYVGTSADPLIPGENTNLSRTRIYFPWSDVGRKVTVAQIWYTRQGDTNPRSMANQDFIITASPADPTGLPYVDIREADSRAQSFDFSRYGYAARVVKGASVTVRVIWNPASFALQNNASENMGRFEQWGRNYRVQRLETYLQREAE